MSEPIEPVKGFMCGLDLRNGLAKMAEGTAVFRTVDLIKLYHPSTNDERSKCGIAEVEIRFIRWIQEPK